MKKNKASSDIIFQANSLGLSEIIKIFRDWSLSTYILLYIPISDSIN